MNTYDMTGTIVAATLYMCPSEQSPAEWCTHSERRRAIPAYFAKMC